MIDNLISFVIPCYRSEKTITMVIDEIIKTVAERPEYDYEIICVNDCSPDNVWTVLCDIAEKNNKVKLINFVQNRGKHAAIIAGHRYVRGEYIVDLDDDYQSPVYNLWKLLEPVKYGECDVATANYYRKKESAFKRFGSWVNKHMVAMMLEKPVDQHLDNFSVMQRYISDDIIKYSNPFPYFEGLIFSSTKNFKVVMMEQRDRADDNGTGYTFKKSFNLWINGLTAFSVKPLRFASLMGILFALCGFVGVIVVLFQRFVTHSIYVLGYASLACLVLFASGVMMLMLGMLGEYIGRMYISLNNVPQYTVKQFVNIDAEDVVK